jgi:benzoate membrane transport protein
MSPALRSAVSGQAVAAGVSAAVLGYASSVAVVVAGLTAVGAEPAEVASGLLAVGALMGVTSVVLSVRTRLPVSVVWTTPGVALLAVTGAVEGGFPAVVGGLALTGALIALTGLLAPITRALQRLPVPLTSGVLAGVLLPFCLAPVEALGVDPLRAAPILIAWLAAVRWAPSWAAPTALAALLVVVAVDGSLVLPRGGEALPSLALVVPTLPWPAITQIALPVYLVTMAAQNLVGVAVLSAQGYRVPVGGLLVGTGAASVVGAPFGAPTLNLAAITGALTAGPAAHPDPARRWVAAVAAGLAYLVLGALSPVTAALVTGIEPQLVTAAAGLGLLGAFTASIALALRDEGTRLPAAVTVLVTASGLTVLGVGSAPLGLAAGGLLLAIERRRAARSGLG